MSLVQSALAKCDDCNGESELHWFGVHVRICEDCADVRYKRKARMRLAARLSKAFGENIQIDPVDYLEKVLAGMFCRQPDMSGDQRNRLNPKELGAVKKVTACLIKAILAKDTYGHDDPRY